MAFHGFNVLFFPPRPGIVKSVDVPVIDAERPMRRNAVDLNTI